MSRKSFYWLLATTIVVTLLVLVFPDEAGRESGSRQTVLIPGLTDQVNDISWFRLTAAGGEVIATLRRDDSEWVLEEVDAYRADWGRVKTLLYSLSQAEVLEEKTSKPEYYPRLGVEDVSSDEAVGVMVEFSDDSGLSGVIIGNGARGREGQYARLVGAEKSLLVDTSIDMPREQTAWLDKSIIDISDAEVVEYEIIHPDGESIKAVKTSANDESFELENIPAGREIKSEQSVGAPANSLAALDLQAVVPAAQLFWDNSTRFRVLTADGLMVESELLTVESGEGEGVQSEHWLRLNAGVYTTAVGPEIDNEEENAITYSRAEELNKRVGGWAYRIPAYSFESMTRRMDALLLKVDKDESPPP